MKACYKIVSTSCGRENQIQLLTDAHTQKHKKESLTQKSEFLFLIQEKFTCCYRTV